MRKKPLGLERVGLHALLLAGWLALSASAWADPGEPHRDSSPSPAWQSHLPPFAWHREHWRERRQHALPYVLELPASLFERYDHRAGLSRPDEPPRPDETGSRQRQDMWRDDVVGEGSGGRIENHPQGRIVRSRPRSE